MLTIGLTGGIASGKSTVAEILSSLGAEVVDADRFGHHSYASGTRAFEEVVDTFGPEVVGADGEIDRRRLGAVVFRDSTKLAALTRIVWPEIRRVLLDRIEQARARGTTRVFAVEAAVLFEAGWDDLCDEVWVVVAPEEEVMKRLQTRKGITRELARARIRAQAPPAERASRADVTISNSGDLESLRRTVTRLWSERTKGKA